VLLYPAAEQKAAQYEADGLGRLPICVVKTHLSLSADPRVRGAPEGFRLAVRDMRAYTGAGWIVPLCGEIAQMPALGGHPAAHNVDIDSEGRTLGLF
jgi:formate--tetrahydrofolate ligase